MSGLDDLEAAMAAEEAATARAARSRARVAAFDALPAEDQRRMILGRPDPESHAAAKRTLRLHGRPSLHDHLERMEAECLTLADSPPSGSR